MLGPSMTQLSVLSVRRPLLSLVLAIGTTGFYMDRLFSVESVADMLASVHGERFLPRLRGTWWGLAIGVFEYVAGTMALINVLQMALRLGDRTVISFKCSIWWFPLFWVMSLAAIFLLVAIPFQFSAVARRVRNGSNPRRNEDPGPEGPDDSQWVPLQQQQRQQQQQESYYASRPDLADSQSRIQYDGAPTSADKPLRANSAKQAIMGEVMTSMGRHPSLGVNMPEFEFWLSGVFSFATFLASLHVILGTVWFSSIMFLSPTDAIQIIMRFIASATACRIITMLELASMKGREIEDMVGEGGGVKGRQSRGGEYPT